AMRCAFDQEPGDTEALRKLQAAFAEPPPPTFVVLSGGTGVGKTVAATWWAATHGAGWVTAEGLARMDRYSETAKVLYHGRLVIDDLGAEFSDGKGFFLSTLDHLINVRYASMLPTVITTNVQGMVKRKDGTKEYPFSARYGERIADRLKESGRWMTIAGL